MTDTLSQAWEKSPTQQWLRDNPDKGAQYLFKVSDRAAMEDRPTTFTETKNAFKEAGPAMDGFVRDFLKELGKRKAETLGDLFTNLQEVQREMLAKNDSFYKSQRIQPQAWFSAKGRNSEAQMLRFSSFQSPINEYQQVTQAPGLLSGRSIDSVMLDVLAGKDNKQPPLSLGITFSKLMIANYETGEETTLYLGSFGAGMKMDLNTPIKDLKGSGPLFDKVFSQTASIMSPNIEQSIDVALHAKAAKAAKKERDDRWLREKVDKLRGWIGGSKEESDKKSTPPRPKQLQPPPG